MSLPLNTLFIGKNLIVYESLPSTNLYAQQLLAQNPIEGTVIFTDKQTSGKGQAGNEWFSAEEKNLTFSLILKPHFLALDELFLISKMVAVALRSALQAILPEGDFQIKWANDILLEKKKIAGILIENQLDGNRLNYSIIGIGVNINQILFPPNITDSSISLKQFSGKDFDIFAVLCSILAEIEKLYLPLKQGNKNFIETEYLQKLYGYQEDISLEIDGKWQNVHLVGVEKSGKLAVIVAGKMRYFDIKEVKWAIR